MFVSESFVRDFFPAPARLCCNEQDTTVLLRANNAHPRGGQRPTHEMWVSARLILVIRKKSNFIRIEMRAIRLTVAQKVFSEKKNARTINKTALSLCSDFEYEPFAAWPPTSQHTVS